MEKEYIKEKRSTLIQIMNEVDDLTDDEKGFVLYWLKAKKNSLSASQADATILPNNLASKEIYKERNALRNQNQ